MCMCLNQFLCLFSPFRVHPYMTPAYTIFTSTTNDLQKQEITMSLFISQGGQLLWEQGAETCWKCNGNSGYLIWLLLLLLLFTVYLEPTSKTLIMSHLKSKQESSHISRNHRITQNQPGWKRPLRSARPTHGQTPPCQPDHGTQCHIQY